ncbi:hypothetical protein JCM19231_3583 [Vibrio ishigakensis]|uniref:Uncharacterized protein n=1 Tax=Vibrio ishigakensis TaxID=1481914 RepID=A0A0B8NSD5_9VIBR|nr:hypothetical protein JCM19231_3583 [Vibrio ishigakensis]
MATGIAAERAESGDHEGFTYLRATEYAADTNVWSHLSPPTTTVWFAYI